MAQPYRPAPLPPEMTLMLAALPAEDRERFEQAFQFAAAAHAGQLRDEGTPYIEHPVRVAAILWQECGYRDDADLLIAALTHDILEDCENITVDVLNSAFGPRVSRIVQDLTKEPVPAEQRAARDRAYMDRLPELPFDSRVVKLADRIDNLRSVVHAGDPAKAQRYLTVSRDEFLPLAMATDATAARLIAEACDEIARYLMSLEGGA